MIIFFWNDLLCLSISIISENMYLKIFVNFSIISIILQYSYLRSILFNFIIDGIF